MSESKCIAKEEAFAFEYARWRYAKLTETEVIRPRANPSFGLTQDYLRFFAFMRGTKGLS